MSKDTCLWGPECGLCFTRRNPVPLKAHRWRTLLGPVAKYETGRGRLSELWLRRA